MRNEKTHFYGYLQTPSGHTLGLVSQQPVASWSVDYNLGYQDPAPFWFMGHRIESLNLDLLNALPLPVRHPQDLYELKQGESKEWTFLFINVGKLDNLEYAITQAADIPLIDIRQTSYTAHEEASFMLTADTPEVKVTNDVGAELPVVLRVNVGWERLNWEMQDFILFPSVRAIRLPKQYGRCIILGSG